MPMVRTNEPMIALHFLVLDFRNQLQFQLMTTLVFLYGYRSVG